MVVFGVELDCEVAKLKSTEDIARKACCGDYRRVDVALYSLPCWGRWQAQPDGLGSRRILLLYRIKEYFEVVFGVELDCEVAKLKSSEDIARKA